MQKRFIVWYKYQLNGEIDEMCGSDSITFFDNRKSVNTIISETLSPENKYLDFQKKRGAIGFKIVRGTILKNTPITELIKI